MNSDLLYRNNFYNGHRMNQIIKDKEKEQLLEQIWSGCRNTHQRDSQGILDFIRIRNGPLEENRYFYTSTWTVFKAKVEAWKVQNLGWWDKDHCNYQESLALNLNLYLRNGDDEADNGNAVIHGDAVEAMRLIMCLFDVIDDSPFKQYLKINEENEQEVIR